MSATTEDIESWINEAMLKKGINNYKLDIIGSSAKGEGYLGEISFVKVTADISGNEKIYEMVVKSAKNNDELREKSSIAETYLREIRMYLEVFPVIKQIQKDFAIENSFTNFPNCYSACKIDKKEAIILTNLKTLGFEIHDRTVPQNFEHALFVFQTYAKWHGSSLALKIKRPEVFKNVTKNMTDLMGDFIIKSQMEPVFLKYFQKGIELLNANGNTEAARKVVKEAGNIAENLSQLTLCSDMDAETEAVILHGDCWNNNMMFKYKETDKTKPIDIVLIDFQLSRLASPILDLSYYLYATAAKATLDKFDYLIEEYHRTLKNYLRQYDIDCDDVLTLKRLKTSWKKYAKFGLGMAAFIVRTELAQENEVVDFMEKIADGTMAELDIGTIKLQKEYETRIHDVYKHYSEFL